ncbi:MAG TPA: hypothetical protein VHF07_07155 [Nitrospiraceae bacterium]|nr:hypothetical protein [Nitrospiraceae bacterium]
MLAVSPCYRNHWPCSAGDTMQFDPALAAQAAFHQAGVNNELGADWDHVLELEETFSSNAGQAAKEAYEQLLHLSSRYPSAHAFQAFCIYITWQQVTEETIPQHFRTGVTLCEAYLANPDGKNPEDITRIGELYGSFREGLGLQEEDETQQEFRRDTVKGGD